MIAVCKQNAVFTKCYKDPKLQSKLWLRVFEERQGMARKDE
jgi:hypothetical protein